MSQQQICVCKLPYGGTAGVCLLEVCCGAGIHRRMRQQAPHGGRPNAAHSRRGIADNQSEVTASARRCFRCVPLARSEYGTPLPNIQFLARTKYRASGAVSPSASKSAWRRPPTQMPSRHNAHDKTSRDAEILFRGMAGTPPPNRFQKQRIRHKCIALRDLSRLSPARPALARHQ